MKWPIPPLSSSWSKVKRLLCVPFQQGGWLKPLWKSLHVPQCLLFHRTQIFYFLLASTLLPSSQSYCLYFLWSALRPVLYMGKESVKTRLQAFTVNMVGIKMYTHQKKKCYKYRSKAHKRLKELFLIGRNRTKCANFWGSPLFHASYNIKTEKQLIQLILCQLEAGGWQKEKGMRPTDVIKKFQIFAMNIAQLDTHWFWCHPCLILLSEKWFEM